MTRRRRRGLGLLTAEDAKKLRRREALAHEWLKQHRSGRGGWTSYDPNDPTLPHVVRADLSNEERNELELFEFLRNRPDKYFAYYNRGETELMTFMSGKLADIIWHGKVFRSNMGDTRFHIRARAITGDEYTGTCTDSAGTYCRIKKVRRARRR